MHEACGVEQNIDLADARGDSVDRRGVTYVKPCDLLRAARFDLSERLVINIGCDH